jgi:putative CocE/NonD family hydrolase
MTDTREEARVELQWGVKISLRHGIHLQATLYTPTEQPTPMPVIYIPTPYVADTHHGRGMYFAGRGWPVIIVDVRGRGNSGGNFRPFIQEANDGYDVVEWIARQSFCNGQVAMLGGSYMAYCQWATAKEFPPHLATIVPAAAPYAGVDSPMRNNILHPYLLQWLMMVEGATVQNTIFADRAYWSGKIRAWHESGHSFRELDQLLGHPSMIFQEWLDHPEPDAYWDAHNPTAEEYARIEIPILTITGSYDDDQPGALEHYRLHMRHGSPAARAQHYLIIGPWDHLRTGWRNQANFGDLTCGPESLVDMPKLHLDWFVWTLQKGPRPPFLKQRVAYYVMGAERWRYAETLDEITAKYRTYFLDSAANADDLFSSGRLAATPGSGAPDSYRYDPCDGYGPEVAAEALADGSSLVDQSVLSALRGKALFYHSAPFEKDTEISGFFRLSAWISIDCPDTDVYASVYEITLDGDCIRLSTDALRARYREGLRTPRLIETRAPLRYDFERFTFISRQIRRGHRLRLVVAPMGRLIETTFAQKNYNGGGVVAEESSKDGKAVTVRLFHDEDHPSALHVPLGREEALDTGAAGNHEPPSSAVTVA